MDKSAFDRSEDEQQTPKASGASSTVLNILKRFRSRGDVAGQGTDSFDERLGAASEPLAERISEISSKIEAGRAKDAERAGASAATENESAETAPEVRAEAAHTGIGDAPSDETESRRKPRIRAMGFHNPVFPVKMPDESKDPDFLASTEPPAVKLHDAPDGVMENYGAPEKRLTPPKEKHAEPLDLRVFAEHVRSKLPKPEPKPEVESPEDTGDRETMADAADFKKQFYSRISKASVFDAAPQHQEQNVLHMPPTVMNLGTHEVSASRALRSWRDFQSASEQPGGEAETEQLHQPVRPVDYGPPAEPQPDAALAGAGPEDAAPAEPEWQNEVPAVEEGAASEPAAEARTETAAPPEPETYEEPEPETFSDLAPIEQELQATEEPDPAPEELQPASVPAPEQADFETPATRPEKAAPPENVFAALDIDEDEILMRVYDLVQSELQAAWGENITLNIRKIVRDEVRAAVEKARSEL